MNRWLQRGAPFLPMIRHELARAHLPEDLCWLPMIESGFSNSAVSHKGAVGLWQLMPATAREYGLRVDGMVDERRNPRKATRAAIQYLSDLMSRFESPCLAAAAYNAGSTPVLRGLERLGDPSTSPDKDSGSPERDGARRVEFVAAVNRGAEEPSFSDADFFRLADASLLVRETREYVPRFIAASTIGRNPGRYGFRPRMEWTEALDTVVVTQPTRLDLVAKAAGVPAQRIRDLNPEFILGVTPPGSRATLLLPRGSARDAGERIAALPPAAIDASVLAECARIEREQRNAGSSWNPRTFRPGKRSVSARSGDTLENVARRCGISASTLARLNHLPRGYPLQSGQIVRLP